MAIHRSGARARLRRRPLLASAAAYALSAGMALVFGAASAPASTAAPLAILPAQAPSPWPSMRHDLRNSGQGTIRAAYHGDRPFSFLTGRGLFITPVIGGDGTVYFGSADHEFYALAPTAGCAGSSRPETSSMPPPLWTPHSAR